MRKILLYPGAFNPPHFGHVEVVELTLKNQSFDEVWIIPSGKREDKIISTTYEDRRNLGNLFVEFLKTRISIPVKLLTDELDDTEGRFTSEILEKIKSQPGVEITQLCGLDGMLKLYPKLVEWGLSDTEKYIVIMRAGYELPSDFVHGDNIAMVSGVQLDISSTQIRDMVHNGDESYQKLVPEEIFKYIKKHSLY